MPDRSRASLSLFQPAGLLGDGVNFLDIGPAVVVCTVGEDQDKEILSRVASSVNLVTAVVTCVVDSLCEFRVILDEPAVSVVGVWTVLV